MTFIINYWTLLLLILFRYPCSLNSKTISFWSTGVKGTYLVDILRTKYSIYILVYEEMLKKPMIVIIVFSPIGSYAYRTLSNILCNEGLCKDANAKVTLLKRAEFIQCTSHKLQKTQWSVKTSRVFLCFVFPLWDARPLSDCTPILWWSPYNFYWITDNGSSLDKTWRCRRNLNGSC